MMRLSCRCTRAEPPPPVSVDNSRCVAVGWGDPNTMSGRQRLPSGEPRKASQRKSRPAAPATVRVSPTWRAGDAVHWKGRAGVFRRAVGDDQHAEIVIAERVYRVRTTELA